MPESTAAYDAVIVGGGFYGAAIAVYLSKMRGLERILLVEREPRLLTRASFHNQARVHNGYHYPRSFTTAYRSRVNLPRFVRDWPEAITRDFTSLYAIARTNSKVTARQFERFCGEIGAALRPATAGLRALFEPRLVESVYAVEEFAFDPTVLARWALAELEACGVTIRCRTRATAILAEPDGLLRTVLQCSVDGETTAPSRFVFNCTYSGLNQFGGAFPGTRTALKQEIAELALVEAPPELDHVGVTVMDGAFFSMMPFPARGLHTLSHVRYTPHLHWRDAAGIDPYQLLAEHGWATRVDRMVRDAARYLPAIRAARHVESMFEVKTVLVKNEGDDGRPILFEAHPELPGCYSVLGGKIDNIYDVLEKLDGENFDPTAPRGTGGG